MIDLDSARKRQRFPWAILIGSTLLGLLIGAFIALWQQPLSGSEVLETVAANLGIFDRAAATLSAPSPALATENATLSEATAGSLAPDFTLRNLAGDPVKLSDLRGRPVLINFWASWCGPCRLEMPDLVRAYTAHKAEGFVILAVNPTFEDTLPEVKAFVKEFNMTFPVLLDETGEVTNQLYRLRGLPTSVFVNRAGRITRIHLGAMTNQQITEFVGEIQP